MKKLLTALLLAALLVGCAPKNQRFSAVNIDCFDTVTQLIAYTDTQKDFDKLKETVFSELERYHKLFDAYQSYDGVNNIKTINDNAGKTPVKVDEELFEMLEFSKSVYALTNQKTNIALGSVLNLWHTLREDGLKDPKSAKIPTADELSVLAEHTDIEDLVLDRQTMTVFLKDPEMRLDVGATAKGFAAEKIADLIRSLGVNSAAISLGGNVVTVGARADGSAWSIGIQDPQNPDGTVMSTKLADTALVTSGDYQRYYFVGDTKYHHIIDPDTLMPARYFSSVSVIGPSSALADALSTALFCMPYEDGLKIVEETDGVQALWITPDGTQYTSSGFMEAVS